MVWNSKFESLNLFAKYIIHIELLRIFNMYKWKLSLIKCLKLRPNVLSSARQNGLNLKRNSFLFSVAFYSGYYVSFRSKKLTVGESKTSQSGGNWMALGLLTHVLIPEVQNDPFRTSAGRNAPAKDSSGLIDHLCTSISLR